MKIPKSYWKLLDRYQRSIQGATAEILRLRKLAKDLQYELAVAECGRRRLRRKVRELEADLPVQEEINGL